MCIGKQVDLGLELQEDMKQEKTGFSSSILYTEEENEYADLEDVTSQHTKSNEVDHSDIKESSHIRCLQDMLKDSQSDMSISIYSLEESDSEVIPLIFSTKINPHPNGCVNMMAAFGCAFELNCKSLFNKWNYEVVASLDFEVQSYNTEA